MRRSTVARTSLFIAAVPVLALALTVAARADVVFASQSGQVSEYINSDGLVRLTLTDTVPNTDVPSWGYNTQGLLPFQTSGPSAGDNNSVSAYLDTFTTFLGGGVLFDGQGLTQASSSSDIGQHTGNDIAQVSYETSFSLTSSYSYTLTVLASTGGSFFLEKNNGTLFDYNGFGAFGPTFTGTFSAGNYTLGAGSMTEVSSSNGGSGAESSHVQYFLALTPITPVPIPGAAYLLLSGLAGLYFAKGRRSAA